jgi:hypothetical protein
VKGALLPLLLGLGWAAIRGRSRRAAAGLTGLLIVSVLVAERGRRVDAGTDHFPPSAALWAPVWLVERAVCVWIAVGYRLTGGVPYAGRRLRRAAHSLRWLRRQAADGQP